MISAATVDRIRAIAARFMTCTYTRTPRTAGAANDWNVQAATDGTPATLQPCHYKAADSGQRAEVGRLVQHAPILLVPIADPIATGDLVSNVQSAVGAVLLAGPLLVTVVEQPAPLGEQMVKRVHLDSIQAALSAEAG